MKRSDRFSEIRDIADDVCSDSATEEQIQQLEKMLAGNSEAKRFYFDYIRLNDALSSASERNMEVVHRRITEEIIVRPQSTSDCTNSAFIHPNSINESKQTNSTNYYRWLLITSLLAILIVTFYWLVSDKVKPAFSAKIIQGQISIFGKGEIDDTIIYSGDYRIEQDTILELDNGDLFSVSEGSQLKIFSESEVKLKSGSLSIKSESGNSVFVHGSNYRLTSNGNSLSLDLTGKQPIVTSGQKTTLHAQRWRPKHFWPFEGKSDRVVSSVSNAHGIADSGAVRVKGLVGDSAFYFDNSANARIAVGSGGGTAPATGSFSVTDGLTIEALIAPQYTGHIGENDEIFRKGHLDGELRVSLGLRHARSQSHPRPQLATSESLSFGLYLVGQGYHELKLPLDGKYGRPTLAQLNDGSTYHVVASYNVHTGLKAIYINGKQLASYQYPPGSKMLSGGPGKAAIGNNPTKKQWQKFAFSGTIDELAFYDFSLPPFMVSHHFLQAQQGTNYFGLPPNDKQLPNQIKIPLPPYSTVALDTRTGLPEREIE